MRGPVVTAIFVLAFAIACATRLLPNAFAWMFCVAIALVALLLVLRRPAIAGRLGIILFLLLGIAGACVRALEWRAPGEDAFTGSMLIFVYALSLVFCSFWLMLGAGEDVRRDDAVPRARARRR